ncbi:MoxR family ATPase [Sporolactobacillus sp. THM19-2]|jgi:MoxR-like ATPase|uniref:AAA family ATPase n=1 Tax=Sporolactobacillus sp. THM19-2 TaxID=2511171 RepID=UPI00102082BF|nr:MoxR family ATPase [Sporolactobacillus sp. THM19-2]RYL94458.1 MoxR family ATPase [Sporolactobacillus sp. THM19-2]
MNQNSDAHDLISEMIKNVETVVIGKHTAVKLITLAMLAGGHVLIEDIPGVGKTRLVRAMARSIGAKFKRIQFTPDLLPSDITGLSIYNQKSGEFEFRPGPLMGNIILADEINRTSPKTQSALLEGMAEGRITVDGVTRQLPELFFVMATQNPIEYEGTYSLPEAQLDRFLLKLSLGYPSRENELELLNRMSGKDPLEDLRPVLSVEDILEMRREAQQVYVSDGIKNYLLDIITATRNHPMIYLGVSPRGTLSMISAIRARAFIEQRDFVVPDDVKAVAPYVLSHRLVMKPEAAYSSLTAETVMHEILDHVKVPVRDKESVK